MSSSTERMRAHRARQRAALEPVPDPVERDPAELLAPAVEQTLAALELGDRDAAAAQLARRYSAVIDAAADSAAALRAFGPPLTRVLAELQATPASRKATGPAKPASRGPNRIAQLRQAHADTAVKRKRAG